MTAKYLTGSLSLSGSGMLSLFSATLLRTALTSATIPGWESAFVNSTAALQATGSGTDSMNKIWYAPMRRMLRGMAGSSSRGVLQNCDSAQSR